MDLLQLPPLSLYIHIPWCVRKCPYCDFNSHPAPDALDETGYVDALLRDLEQQMPGVQGRELVSIFIGGGTPSLFSIGAIDRLLRGVRGRVAVGNNVEVTLEANPGTLEADRYAGYRDAGVNRLSIGVQSLDPGTLHTLGRIHDPAQAVAAVAGARAAGFRHLNLDLMFGLPDQDPRRALAELQQLIDLGPDHISYYQLTLEPNTAFHRAPPPLPDDDALWAMQEQGRALLAGAGFSRYEVSAYAQAGARCRHNLNYWTFGDYLGIGAGAHRKVTWDAPGWIQRAWNPRDPARYLAGVSAGPSPALTAQRRLTPEELPLEFMINVLRLDSGFTPALFEARTGLPFNTLEPPITRALETGLLAESDGCWRPTPLGQRFLNDLQQLFL